MKQSKRPNSDLEAEHITKTRLFKHIENFATKKNENFQIKILMSTHNLCFEQE